MKKKRPIIITLYAVLLVLVVVFGHPPSNNITCKKQDHGKTELCVQGSTKPIVVPYDTWRNARVGGFYDTGTEKVYGDVNEDPRVNQPAEDQLGPVEEGE